MPEPTKISVQEKPVQCWNCEMPFVGLFKQTVNGVTRLRCGNANIYNLKLGCVHCGELFYWNTTDKALQADAVIFGKVLSRLDEAKNASL